MKITKTICDICEEETKNEEINIQVIFTTEQNEGRCCKPHLCNEKLNLCDKCLNNVLYHGNYIYGNGAMGHNNYFFKNRSDIEELLKENKKQKEVIDKLNDLLSDEFLEVIGRDTLLDILKEVQE